MDIDSPKGMVITFWLWGDSESDIRKILDNKNIKDVRDEIHEYKLPVIMHSHTELIQYCKKHFGWEVIRAYWNPKKNGHDYFVSKHKKF